MPPVTPSATSAIGYSVGTGASGTTFSTSRVTTSRWATVVFLCSPTSTRGTDPARSCRARAPAVTTNSNELGSLLRSIMKCPADLLGFWAQPVQSGALCNDDAPQAIDCRGQLVVDDDVV